MIGAWSRPRVLRRDRVFWCRDKVGQARVFCRNIMFSCCDRVWPNGEVLCHDRAILCHDMVGQAGGIFLRDGVCLGLDRVGQAKGFLSRQNIFMSRQSWLR